MIRRKAEDRFLLIAQHEHALLAGRLARHYGNARFDPPDPAVPTIAAIAMHDCGWAYHDDAPTLNKKNLPLDVFESPIGIALNAWSVVADLVEGEHFYTQLLISLHVLGLSAFASSNSHTPPEVFEINRFQQREIERQEHLRRQLGLAIDIPLKYGLAITSSLPAEQQLKRNHCILQILDRISLALCCTQMPFNHIQKILPRPGAAPMDVVFTRSAPNSLRVDPWPFDVASIQMTIPARAVKAEPFSSLEAFREIYAAAPTEEVPLVVHA